MQARIALWRNRDYMILWGGQAVSSVGTQVVRLAFPLYILYLTGSPAQAGLANSFNVVPYVVLGLAAGVAADRWDRKRTMILCDSGRTLALLSVPVAAWSGHLTLIQLYLVALVEGSLNVFFDLAEVAALPRVVSTEQLPAAMSQNSATFSLSSLLGQPIGGVLFEIGRAVPFLVDGLSYGCSVVSLLFIRTRFQVERTSPLPSVRSQVSEGFRWMWHQPLIRFLAFLNAGLWVAFSGVPLLVIVLARQHHASPAAIGLMLGGIGVGGVVGALLVSPIQRRFGFPPVVIGGMVVSACLWSVYALLPPLVVVAAVAAVGAAVFNLYNVVQMSYRIALIPNELQGRVNSVFRLISFSGQPIGMALMGASLQTVGVRPTALVGGAWLLGLAVISAANVHVRGAAALSDVAA